MKDDRNMYNPGMGNPMPGFGYPGMMGTPYPNFPINMQDQNYNQLENRISALERQVRRLENRVSKLENQYPQPTPYQQQITGQPNEPFSYQTSMQPY